jgi:hypothetical protein
MCNSNKGGGDEWGRSGTPEGDTRTVYVQCVALRGKLPSASGTYEYSTQKAGRRRPYVQHRGPGAYV